MFFYTILCTLQSFSVIYTNVFSDIRLYNAITAALLTRIHPCDALRPSFHSIFVPCINIDRDNVFLLIFSHPVSLSNRVVIYAEVYDVESVIMLHIYHNIY